jgi:hypothetical protein
MIEDNFNVLLTFDKNLQFQQNFNKYTISVIVLSAPINTYEELTKLSPKIIELLKSDLLKNGPNIIQ